MGRSYAVFLTLLATLTPSPGAAAQQPAGVQQRVTGRVVAFDRTKAILVLQEPGGQRHAFDVGRASGLPVGQVQIGDVVTISYAAGSAGTPSAVAIQKDIVPLPRGDLHQVRGRVISVDQGRGILVLEKDGGGKDGGGKDGPKDGKGGKIVISLAQISGLANLAPGAVVTVQYSMRGGQFIAQQVTPGAPPNIPGPRPGP